MPLPFISESVIDEVLDLLDTDKDLYEKEFDYLTTEQLGLAQYLIDEEFNSLTSDEREGLIFLTVVIIASIHRATGGVPTLTLDDLEKSEDENWSKVEHLPANQVSQRFDLLFQDYQQEDLLAFIEDSLVVEDGSFVTKEGKEPMFIVMKSVIDAFHDNAE